MKRKIGAKVTHGVNSELGIKNGSDNGESGSNDNDNWIGPQWPTSERRWSANVKTAERPRRTKTTRRAETASGNDERVTKTTSASRKRQASNGNGERITKRVNGNE